MSPGRLLAVAIAMLGAGPLPSGAEQAIAAPDAIAERIQACLHGRYADQGRLALVDRVLGIEQRIGAYRAARTQVELVERLNADLRVAMGDRRVRVTEASASSGAGVESCDLGATLQLEMPPAPL
ncbi:hypothetical protein [Dyella jiangningensis]|uniref:Uncharacterized protein n=1 Tax=Dyella jiangningensis TaxID=1379159 RepID=A0A328P8F3_9GAMM|nr:hypothetical protein [Dyella jiangningensis]RAO76584.1 hypothetical protein CA260_01265 [Dyella jiangningensis]